MYSVVLMMAMSGTAAEAPAGLFHHGGGCTGYSGCTGSCNGWGGCTGAAAGWGGAACYGSTFAYAQHVACYGYSLNCVGFGCFGTYPTYFAGPVTPYHYIPTIPPTTREVVVPPVTGGEVVPPPTGTTPPV